MDTYYTVEEKYLQAVDEARYGETPKALKLFNDIIAEDPLHARTHFQLGKIYYYDMSDYQTAGYHFKTCSELEPAFPDVYYHYLHLLLFLEMKKQFNAVKEKALTIAGVNKATILNLSGLMAEKDKNWSAALTYYREAFMEVTQKSHKEEIEENLQRLKTKVNSGNQYRYSVV
jgi:tetratricopeptide (TPR) repeat protein